jgi:hypothetical protein
LVANGSTVFKYAHGGLQPPKNLFFFFSSFQSLVGTVPAFNIPSKKWHINVASRSIDSWELKLKGI